MLSYTDIIFAIAACALTLLNVLLAATIFARPFRLWPTPGRNSWQHWTFWTLFRGGLGLTLLYALLTVRAPAAGEYFRFALGLICVVIGFGFTVYGYFNLGIENTYGDKEGLVTGGMYRYSRNPQCVSSMLGFFGVGLAHGGVQAVVLAALAILVYMLMPYTEEPWLRQAYGDAYDSYARRVRRFL